MAKYKGIICYTNAIRLTSPHIRLFDYHQWISKSRNNEISEILIKELFKDCKEFNLLNIRELYSKSKKPEYEIFEKLIGKFFEKLNDEISKELKPGTSKSTDEILKLLDEIFEKLNDEISKELKVEISKELKDEISKELKVEISEKLEHGISKELKDEISEKLEHGIFEPRIFDDDQSEKYRQYRFSYLESQQLNFNDVDLTLSRFFISKKRVEPVPLSTQIKNIFRFFISKKRGKNDEKSYNKGINYNEFCLLHNDKQDAEFDIVMYDMALLLGTTRSRLFSPDVSNRIYNILLPIGRGKVISEKDNQNEVDVLIIPFLTLHRKPSRPNFRRIISMNLWLIPQKEGVPDDIDYEIVRGLTDRKLFGKHRDKPKLNLKLCTSHLKQFLQKIDEEPTSVKSMSVEDLLFYISKIIYKKIIGPDYKDQELDIYTQANLSTEIALSFNTDLDDSMLQVIVKEKSIEKLEYELKSDLIKMLNPNINNDIQDVMVQNKIRKNAIHLFLYNVDSHLSVLILDKARERFSEGLYSIKWGLAGITMLTQGISSLRIIFHSFHREAEKKSWYRSRNLEKILLSDLEEYYDLDIQTPYYKEYFENVKKKIGINEDYNVLRDRLRAIREISTTEALHYLTILGTILTIATVLLQIDGIQKELSHEMQLWSIIPLPLCAEILCLVTAGIAILWGIHNRKIIKQWCTKVRRLVKLTFQVYIRPIFKT